ncbi:MAG: OmpA family protein [Deltaproteobacteria bacterium]|nr:OmpA family protein [Deltaproteobacteria bacterium]MBW2393603.1 OmpA family protein [Deltaproteobacteria bacterium]
MKRSTGSSCLPRLPERVLVAALTFVGLFASACVLPGKHAEVVAERDAQSAERVRLEGRVTLLEASNESLSGERVALLEQVEDLRLVREELGERKTDLESHVQVLSARRDELESDLTAREREVAEEQEEVGKLRDTYDDLVGELQSEVAAGRIEIERLREGLRVNLAQEILFAKGSAQLSSGGRAVLARVASRLGGDDHRVQVQGHTDAHVIQGRLARVYPTNWELAGARAAAVVRILEREGVSSARLAAISYGPNRPVAPNDTSEGRARNRRIEIRLLPIEGAGASSAASAGGE